MEPREESARGGNCASKHSKHYGAKTISLLKAYQKSAHQPLPASARSRAAGASLHSLNFDRSASGYFHSALHPVMGTLSIPPANAAAPSLTRNPILPTTRSFSRPQSAAPSPSRRRTSYDRAASAASTRRRRSNGPDLRTWRRHSRDMEQRFRSMHIAGKSHSKAQSGPKAQGSQGRCQGDLAKGFEEPEDGVIFAVSSTIPGYPVVYRTAKAKAVGAERLDLDKRELPVCPIVEGEAKLRLLNYQNNAIVKISNLANLPSLVLVDLHANRITVIEGLEAQRGLRVLLLGKNQIKTIENIDHCTKLDVLDLQSNLITRIQNLHTLTCLRVLNLAGNALQHVDNIKELQALVELNLSRNKIDRVKGVDKLPHLERLFLADNRIAKYELVQSVLRISNTIFKELSIAGNMLPGIGNLNYQQVFVDRLLHLETMDQKPVTKELREEITKKAAENKDELMQTSSPMGKEARKEEIRQIWHRSMKTHHATGSRCVLESWISSREGAGRVDSNRQITIPGYWEKAVHNGAQGIRIFGTNFAALDEIGLQKGEARISCVFLSYSTLPPLLTALKKLEAIKTVKHLSFSFNALESLEDVAQVVQHLPSSVSSVTITDNSVTQLELYRPWFIFCVEKHKKKVLLLDGHYIKKGECSAAKKLFHPLAGIDSPWRVPGTRLSRAQGFKEAENFVEALVREAAILEEEEEAAEQAWHSFLKQQEKVD